MRSLLIWLVLCSATYATEPSQFPAVQRIKDAYANGGPLPTCWNTQAGWNLNRQVEDIKNGIAYAPTIYIPIEKQGANLPNRWTNWIAEYGEALDWINAQGLPITVRSHNRLNDFTDIEPEDRYPMETSPLVWRLREDGSLDSTPVVDPLGPVAAWTELGEKTATSYWIGQLAARTANCPWVYWLENNEGNIQEIGSFTTTTNELDAWRYRKRAWRPNMQLINLRMVDYMIANEDPNDLERGINRLFRERYEAFTTSLLANLPSPWKGKVFTGGYGAMGDLKEGITNRQVYSYERPQNDWSHSPWSPGIWRFQEPSERCYNDGSGGPFDWDDWYRAPENFQMNAAPVNAFLAATRNLPHRDLSYWYSPTRGREASKKGHGGETHSGYVTPERVKGSARRAIWADKLAQERRATLIRWFAASQTQRAEQWYDSENDPPEVRDWTVGDFYNQMVAATEEVWQYPELLRFWRDGKAVLNPDPALCNWVLPPDVVDDRSRLLPTDADQPRYDADGKDNWRANNGQNECKVAAFAFRIGEETLVFACSPRETRENVTVTVPGIEGGVLFDVVDPDGEWRIPGRTLPERVIQVVVPAEDVPEVKIH